MADFLIAGVHYQSKTMDAETQIFVIKRLLPTFTALVGAKPLLDAPLDGAEEPAGEGEPDGAAPSLHDLLMPVARELARISDADTAFILNACLDVTRRQAVNGVGWVGVRQRGIIQDQADAKFMTRLTIAYHVLAENCAEMLGSFGLDMARLASVKLPLG